jgi:hypothetical protein
MSVSVVEKLIEQRRLFQDWLTKLAADVEGMPPHVVARVRNDYRARLDGVVTELGEHSDALRDALDEAQLRHDGLDAQQQAKKDELAELRLRRHVGEMDDAGFKEQSAVMKVALDGLQKELGAALRDIERYEEILEIIAADAAPPPAEEVAEPEPPLPPVAAVPAPERSRPAPAPAPKAEAPAAPEAPREPRRSSPDVARGSDELAFLRSMTTAASAVKTPRPAEKPAPREEKPVVQEQRPLRPEPAAPVAQATDDTFDAAPHMLKMPISEHDAPDEPAVAPAKPAAKDEAVALTCGECGATNRPTEWYCEKCGAELAAF